MTAIDFKRLILEEKKKARALALQKRKNQKVKNEQAAIKERESKLTTGSQQLCSREVFDISAHVGTVRPDITNKKYITLKKLDSQECPKVETPQFSLSRHQVGADRLSNVYYMPNFLPSAYLYEVLLPWLQSIPSCPRPTLEDCSMNSSSALYWTTLRYSQRRVMMLQSPFPPLIEAVAQALFQSGVTWKDRNRCVENEGSTSSSNHPPNHVLINEYQPSMGILPHTDGPEYQDKTATVSLGGSDVILRFTKRLLTDEIGSSSLNQENRSLDKPILELVLGGNGSLVVFEKDAYTKHLHSIKDGIFTETIATESTNSTETSCVSLNENGVTLIERGYRISLTFDENKT
eukprot:CAMPEP_0194356426 /NCGR_PEP_ID=MMETSP0174-20130528/4082_1 /TAXON_ID=216777 /ORGANISM="Proboscia alata, Strain PI-D3" /LENGTH=347 /DNA_ID=CAMNT_0039126017 /DNA_START=66 /DNA_END=1106 /DNA_ORIENTATION=+